MIRKLLLASSSPYRQQLLQKLQMDFDCCTPDIDESRLPNESAYDMVERLAISKARKLAAQYPQHLIIGSDQVACFGQEILGKSLEFNRAFTQLSQCRGQAVVFLTGLCLHNAATGQTQSSVESYRVKFKDLTDQQITNYLKREEPYDCAGSFKVEGLGISLFDALEGDDPNTLIGLPLIALIRMLNKEGIDPLLA